LVKLANLLPLKLDPKEQKEFHFPTTNPEISIWTPLNDKCKFGKDEVMIDYEEPVDLEAEELYYGESNSKILWVPDIPVPISDFKKTGGISFEFGDVTVIGNVKYFYGSTYYYFTEVDNNPDESTKLMKKKKDEFSVCLIVIN
jgi:hypothetical protein